ncbi:unnamed protein product [Cladocopium goreaui]|uniref:Uncharacterized protein n=1 Tax=Cladocopium goreaui TaxID=2562237 RepID=A0A9P1BPN4_9DINO|nr:unnamed protein product [Cladocopium goreaui]
MRIFRIPANGTHGLTPTIGRTPASMTVKINISMVPGKALCEISRTSHGQRAGPKGSTKPNLRSGSQHGHINIGGIARWWPERQPTKVKGMTMGASTQKMVIVIMMVTNGSVAWAEHGRGVAVLARVRNWSCVPLRLHPLVRQCPSRSACWHGAPYSSCWERCRS